MCFMPICAMTGVAKRMWGSGMIRMAGLPWVCLIFPHALWADNPILRLGVERSDAQDAALVYPDEATWRCDPPFTPATLSARQPLIANWVDERFFPDAAAQARNIVVRRANQAETQTQRRQFEREALHRSEVDLQLDVFFQLCDYEGFIDIIAVDYELLGQIGDLPVALSGTRTPEDANDIQITYVGQKWDRQDDTFSARYSYLGNTVGQMNISLGLHENGFVETIDGGLLDADITMFDMTINVQKGADD